MTKHTQINGFDVVTITSSDQATQASFVPQRGGAGCSLIMQGNSGERELLYLHDNFWDSTIDDLPGGWPFCFPVCARLARDGEYGAYLYDAKRYHLDIHGFAWQQPWRVSHESDDSVTLCLQANDETLAMYPFRFKVELRYQVSRNQLICEQRYTNLDDKPMPYYAGFHPYFLTPSDKQAVQLHLTSTARLQYNAAMTDMVGHLPALTFPRSVSDDELNEQLHVLGDERVGQLTFPNGDVLTLQVDGLEDLELFPYMQTYTMPEKPFICIEPWMSYPNAINTVDGVRWLQPGQAEHGRLLLTLK